MSMICSMTEMKLGERGTVVRLQVKDSLKRRLQDIGLIEGCQLECALQSPGKDPMAYWIRGALIALRNEDCENILLKKEDD